MLEDYSMHRFKEEVHPSSEDSGNHNLDGGFEAERFSWV